MVHFKRKYKDDGKLDLASTEFGRAKLISVSFHETEYSAHCYIHIKDKAKKRSFTLGFDEFDAVVDMRQQLKELKQEFLRENGIDEEPFIEISGDDDDDATSDQEEAVKNKEEEEEELVDDLRIIERPKTEKKLARRPPLKKRVVFFDQEAGPSYKKKKQ